MNANIRHSYFRKENKKYRSVYIGEWRVNRTDEDQNYDWSKLHTTFEVDLTRLKENSSRSNFHALYSEHRQSGYVRIRHCQKCLPNNIIINYTCIPCDKTQMAVGSTCMELPIRCLDISANLNNPFHGTKLFLSVVALSLTLVVVVLFIKSDGNRIVRAYWRDLRYMILAGLAILFIFPFPFLVEPTTIAWILWHVTFLPCYAPLLLKVNRI